MTRATAAVMLGIAVAVAVTSDVLATPSPAASMVPTPAADRARPAAAGGVAILASAARAEAVLAGTVSDVRSIDVHGWRAALKIDRVLLGGARLGETVTIAWEELSRARQVRFVAGQRVLVVLDPLPSQSLWRKRFPARDRAGSVLVLAASGEAFLVTPDGFTLDVLAHYLAMTPEARDGAPGARRLAELVRGGVPTVAREALTALEAKSDLARLLGVDGAPALLAAARSAEREPALRGAALRLAARGRLPGTRETARTLTERSSPIRVDAYRALAELPDGLPLVEVEGLLAESDASLRVVGVEAAPEAIGRDRLVKILRADTAPTVRLAAGHVLLARHLSGAIPDVIAALDDADAAVRTGIAEGIGALGTPAVAPLRTVVDSGSERAARAAILGLSRAGRQGGIVIEAIAESHPKESVRAFARLALGEAPGHEH